MTRTSSSGVKSFTMLKSLRISSGVLPLIMLATVLQPTSLESIKKGGEDKSVSMPRNAQRNKYRHVLGQWDLQEGLNVEVVGREDDLKEHLLIDGDELLVPLADVRRPLACLVLALLRVRCREGLTPVVLAVLEDL